MSAPITAYRDEKLKLVKADGTTVDNYIAIQDGTAQAFKERYYLDGAINVKTQTGNDGVIGFVIDDVNSYNARHHNIGQDPTNYPNSRKGPGRVTLQLAGTIKNCILLNDAGLNTLGHAEIGPNSVLSDYANFIEIDSEYFSSYYDPTIEYGWQHKANASPTWLTIPAYTFLNDALATLPKNSSRRYDAELNSVSYTTNAQVNLRPYIKNKEGYFYGDVTSIFVQAAVMGYAGRFRSSACVDEGGGITTLWMNEADYAIVSALGDNAVTTGVYAYTNRRRTVLAPSGFYHGLADPNRSYYVGPTGEISQAVYCAPPPPTKDAQIYLISNGQAPGYFTVSVTLTVAHAVDVTLSGVIGAFDSNDNQVISNSGAGYWSVTIPAGQTSGSSFETDAYKEPGIAYCKAVLNNSVPAGEINTYDSFGY